MFNNNKFSKLRLDETVHSFRNGSSHSEGDEEMTVISFSKEHSFSKKEAANKINKVNFRKFNNLTISTKEINWFKIGLYLFIICLIISVFVLSLVVTVLNNKLTNKDNNSNNKPNWSEFYITSTNGAVATDNKICSRIGVEVLKKGGNAVDAAIASVLCLGVISPASSGIGGGCFIVIHNATNEKNVFIDSREYAPDASNATMFVNQAIKAQDGALAIAVFSELKGLYLSWQKHGSGKVSWKDLVSPAAKLAEKWTISPQLSKYIKEIKTQLLSGDYEELSLLYLDKNKNLKKTGDIVVQKKLSETLKKIATDGPDYLYKTNAAIIASEIQQAGGIVTEKDIVEYEPKVYPALEAEVLGLLIYIIKFILFFIINFY
jgi:gamma-glutamyltranspeptidase/glutathione hydrolase/leukotriene-C4 hydrolase